VREAEARSVCRSCEVLSECRDWARENREYGYWGGESEEERAAAGFRVDMPVGRVARYPRGEGRPVTPRDARDARIA
jgi:WhiB family redox-sensing transcriptional regulator